MSALKTANYEGCVMLSPEGVMMCRCARKRAEWYVVRDLSEVIAEDPYTIKLTFTPGGLGKSHDEFYLQVRENICAVCGESDNLTRHHCVPYCFRRHFPTNIKESSAHDVLPLCWPCHMAYEKTAHELKSTFVVRRCNQEMKDRLRVFKAARTLISYEDVIPEERRELLRSWIVEAHGYCDRDLLLSIVSDRPEYDDVDWKATVDNIEDIGEFIVMWRKHFVKMMKPRFMPQYWSVEGRIGADG